MTPMLLKANNNAKVIDSPKLVEEVEELLVEVFMIFGFLKFNPDINRYKTKIKTKQLS